MLRPGFDLGRETVLATILSIPQRHFGSSGRWAAVGEHCGTERATMNDEIFYATALQEYESGNADAGMKAKAYVAAEGVEEKIKLEYIKLRVRQLRGGDSAGSLRAWYSRTSDNERALYVALSILFIALFGLGLIPLGILMWLAAGERDELARQAQRRELEQQARARASSR